MVRGRPPVPFSFGAAMVIMTTYRECARMSAGCHFTGDRLLK